jgi:hypothetical protein
LRPPTNYKLLFDSTLYSFDEKSLIRTQSYSFDSGDPYSPDAWRSELWAIAENAQQLVLSCDSTQSRPEEQSCANISAQKLVSQGGKSYAQTTTTLYKFKSPITITLDTSFGNNGVMTMTNPSSVTLAPEEKFYIVSKLQASQADEIRRYFYDGTLDESFANHGSFISSIHVSTLLPISNEEIWIGGYTQGGAAIAKLRPYQFNQSIALPFVMR